MIEIINYIKLLSNNEKVQELLVETIGKILLNQDNLDLFIKENEEKIIHIRDWIASIFENNEEWKTPRVLTIDALNNAADKYFEKKNNKIQTIKLDETHEKLIADLEEYYIVQMLTPEALDNESKQMQHCIGHGYYDENLKNGKYQYLSLRDKYNKSHVTLEINENKVLQLQGKQNKLPEDKYFEKLFSWFFSSNINFDIQKYNLIFNKKDNKFYSIYNMPDNCEIDGNLNLNGWSHCKLKKLPDNLVINGDLNLNQHLIEKLPKGLVIHGNLFLNSCQNLVSLPEDLIVDSGLSMQSTKIKYLPENIKTYSFLDLSSSRIEKLPDNLIVNGNLSLECSWIKELPKNLKVIGYLNLGETGIKKIPDDLFIGGGLNLFKTSLNELPKNLILNGDLDLRYCYELDRLPDNLSVNGSLQLNNTNVIRLPNNLIINGDLSLSYTKIEKLPDNLQIKSLFLDQCKNIEELPNNINIKNLYISGSNLKKLPENLTVDQIFIDEEQINLIEQNINFNKIFIFDLGLKYSKYDFDKKFKNNSLSKFLDFFNFKK